MINLLNQQIFFRFKLIFSSWTVPKNFTGLIEFPSGNKYWHLNGKLHRTDGPAIEDADGIKYWHLNGKNYSEKDWKKEIKRFVCKI